MSMTQLPVTPVASGPARPAAVPDQARRDSGRLTAGHNRARLSAVALVIAGLLFVLYPAIRPFSDETSLPGPQAFASAAWTLAHTFAVLGFIGLCLGLLGVYLKLAGTPAARLSFMTLVVTWIGAGAPRITTRLIAAAAARGPDPARAPGVRAPARLPPR
jgi:hypothetical protein